MESILLKINDLGWGVHCSAHFYPQNLCKTRCWPLFVAVRWISPGPGSVACAGPSGRLKSPALFLRMAINPLQINDLIF